LEQYVEILIIIGAILVLVTAIFAWKVQSLNMRSRHKVQALGLIGLTAVALIAIIVSIGFSEKMEGLIGVASAAVGGIAGFIGHRMGTPNRTVMFPLEDQLTSVGKTLEFTVAGISTANYNLNYTMINGPASANLDSLSGKFSWTPTEEDDKEYNVTFTVNDSMGGSDSRAIKITVQ